MLFPILSRSSVLGMFKKCFQANDYSFICRSTYQEALTLISRFKGQFVKKLRAEMRLSRSRGSLDHFQSRSGTPVVHKSFQRESLRFVQSIVHFFLCCCTFSLTFSTKVVLLLMSPSQSSSLSLKRVYVAFFVPKTCASNEIFGRETATATILLRKDVPEGSHNHLIFYVLRFNIRLHVHVLVPSTRTIFAFDVRYIHDNPESALVFSRIFLFGWSKTTPALLQSSSLLLLLVVPPL